MQVCFRASNKEKWYIDSRCSRHITGDKEKFNSIEMKEELKVCFGGNQSGRITRVGQVGPVKDVYLVDGLCHNLLSVSQCTDRGNWVIFDSNECLIIDKQKLDLDKDSLNCKLMKCVAVTKEGGELGGRIKLL